MFVLPALTLGVMVKVLPGLAMPFAFAYIIEASLVEDRPGRYCGGPGGRRDRYRADRSIAVLRVAVSKQAFMSYRTLAWSVAYTLDDALQMFPAIYPRNPGRFYQATAARS